MNKIEAFEFTSGGFFGGYRHVKFEDGTLHWWHEHMGEAQQKGRFKASPEAWQEFVNELNELDFWQWKEYYRADILDGHQWSIELQVEGALHKSGGSNEYPMRGGKNLFKHAQAALEKLLGGGSL
jgi:hypothetical protein